MKKYLLILFFGAMLAGCGSPPKSSIQSASSFATTSATGHHSLRQSLLSHYQEWRGTPYQWGGQSKRGVDCSGFAQLTYQQRLNKALQRSTKLQSAQGQQIKKSQLRVGDLVFFKPKRKQRHVGIYLGNDEFMHASTSKGVTISRLDSPYWHKAYWQARRIP